MFSSAVPGRVTTVPSWVSMPAVTRYARTSPTNAASPIAIVSDTTITLSTSWPPPSSSAMVTRTATGPAVSLATRRLAGPGTTANAGVLGWTWLNTPRRIDW